LPGTLSKPRYFLNRDDEILVSIKYGSALSEVVGLDEDHELDEAFRSHFEFPNPRYNEEYATAAVANGDDYPETEMMSFLFEGEDFDNPHIPTGLYWAIKSWAKSHKVNISFDGFPDSFENEPEDPDVPEDILEGITLRPYQVDAIKKALAHKRGILEIATGAGKSECCIAITKILGKRTLCVTPDQAAMKNLWSRFNKRGVKAGRLDGKNKETDCDVLVAVINSLYSGLKKCDPVVQDWVDNAEVLFSDEAHHQRARSWVAVASRSNAEYRLFMSGTPFKENKIRENPAIVHEDDSWVIGLSGKTIYYLPPKKLIGMGNLSPGMFVSFPADGPNLHRLRHYPKVYEDGVVKNLQRNSRICTLLSNLVTLDRYPIVGVEKLEHGREIQRTLFRDFGVLSACSYGSGVIYIPKMVAEFMEIPFEEAPIYETKTVYKRGVRKKEKVVVGREDDFVRADPKEVDVVRWLQEGLVRVLIGSRIFDEAQDIPFLTDFVNAAGGKASQRLRQKVGRILRKSKGKLVSWFWDPWDLSHFFLTNHSRKRLEVAKEEGYPVFEDWNFARPMCEFDLKNLGLERKTKVKENKIEVTIGLTLPLSTSGGGNFYVKPVVTVGGELEDGDDLDKCAEILHHKATSLFVREVYRQAVIAGHVGAVGFEKAKDDFVEQAKIALQGLVAGA